jgi:hypothetical protein
MRNYGDEQHSLMVDRDVNAAINLKKLGLDIFPRIKSRGGNLSVVGTIDNSTAKEILHTLHRAAKKPTQMVTACVGVGGCHLGRCTRRIRDEDAIVVADRNSTSNISANTVADYFVAMPEISMPSPTPIVLLPESKLFSIRLSGTPSIQILLRLPRSTVPA